MKNQLCKKLTAIALIVLLTIANIPAQLMTVEFEWMPSAFKILSVAASDAPPSTYIPESSYAPQATAPTLSTATSTKVIDGTEYMVFTKFTATSGTQGTGSDENYWKLVDGDTGTKWCIVNGSYQSSGYDTYIEFKSDMAFIPKGYILTTGGDNSKYNGRNPAGWTIKGKLNENDDWDTIAEVTNDTVLKDENTTPYNFYANDANKLYQYFRFEFSKTKDAEVFQMSELEFFGTIKDNADIAFSSIGSVNGFYTYTGSQITVTPTVTDSNGKALTASTDYTVSLTKGGEAVDKIQDAGNYTFTFTGKGDYKGTQSVSFVVGSTITYIDADKTEKTKSLLEVTFLTGNETELESGWYFANGSIVYNSALTLKDNSDIHIILADRASMTVETSGTAASVSGSGADLTVYGQSAGTGTLNVSNKSESDGGNAIEISGNSDSSNTFTVNSGCVNVSSNKSSAVISPNFIINGGTVTVSGYNAGISVSNDLTVNGGKLTATTYTGYSLYAQGYVTLGYSDINDYIKVYWVRSEYQNIRIADGQALTRPGVTYKRNIGSSYNFEGYKLTPKTYTVTFNIGNAPGTAPAAQTILCGSKAAAPTATEIAKFTPYAATFGGWYQNSGFTGEQFDFDTVISNDTTLYAKWIMPSLTYIGADGNETTTDDYRFITAAQTEYPAGTYAVEGTVNFTSQVKFNGDTFIILKDGAVLKIDTTDENGILADGSITVYTQKEQTGKINAEANEYALKCTTFTQYGGNVTLDTKTKDGYDSSVYGLYADTAYIHNGVLNATGYGSGIKGNYLTVYGGTVTAKAIRSGSYAIDEKYDIEISGGTVTATGGNTAMYSQEGNITLSGGSVYAEGEYGGISAFCGGNITLSGATVFASSTNSTNHYSDYYVYNDKNYKIIIPDGMTYTDDSNNTYTGNPAAADISNKTIYPKNYAVIISDNITNGTVEADKTFVDRDAAGDNRTVTLTVTPNYKYVLDTITVTGAEVKNDTTYTFTMPAEQNVTVSATFKYDPAHFSQDGDTYTIHTATGWEIFCDCVNDDNYNKFYGDTVILGADIGSAESPVTTMAGSSGYPFCGTFDGKGKTLYVDITSINNEAYAAPFRYVEDVDIKNVKVVGTVSASNKYAGGIVGSSKKVVNIENCEADVTIKSTVNGDGTHGGLVGVNEGQSTLNIMGCVFKGKILGEDTTSCGGFVGWKAGSLAVYNSIYAPAAIESGEKEVKTDGSCTMSRNGGTFDNCYYTRTLGEANGKQAYTVTPAANIDFAVGGNYKNYDVSSISTNGTGLIYKGVMYAAAGENVAFGAAKNYTVISVSADYGTLKDNNNGTYTLTMPSSNVTLTADTAQIYTITWNDDSNNLIDTTTVENGTIPSHANPTKASTDEYDYKFIGWTPEVTAVNSDTTYTAKFKSIRKIPTPVISSKAYTGDKLTADVSENEYYIITANEGGINVGDYDVVLTLKDVENTKWADSTEAEKTLTFKITKAKQTVSAPATARVTDTSVTLNKAAGQGTVVYGVNTKNEAPSQWQASTEFTGLTPNTQYYFFVKISGDDNYNSAISEGASVKTLSAAAAIPTEYEIKFTDDSKVLLASPNSGNYCVIFAIYNNDVLVSISAVENITFETAGAQTVDIPAGFETSEQGAVKVFFWRGLTDMTPLCDFAQK